MPNNYPKWQDFNLHHTKLLSQLHKNFQLPNPFKQNRQSGYLIMTKGYLSTILHKKHKENCGNVRISEFQCYKNSCFGKLSCRVLIAHANSKTAHLTCFLTMSARPHSLCRPIWNSSANSVNQTSDVTHRIPWWRNEKPCQHHNKFKWQRN